MAVSFEIVFVLCYFRNTSRLTLVGWKSRKIKVMKSCCMVSSSSIWIPKGVWISYLNPVTWTVTVPKKWRIFFSAKVASKRIKSELCLEVTKISISKFCQNMWACMNSHIWSWWPLWDNFYGVLGKKMESFHMSFGTFGSLLGCFFPSNVLKVRSWVRFWLIGPLYGWG